MNYENRKKILSSVGKVASKIGAGMVKKPTVVGRKNIGSLIKGGIQKSYIPKPVSPRVSVPSKQPAPMTSQKGVNYKSQSNNVSSVDTIKQRMQNKYNDKMQNKTVAPERIYVGEKNVKPTPRSDEYQKRIDEMNKYKQTMK
jgi:hypothetical protein